jgi:hypothetical protein
MHKRVNAKSEEYSVTCFECGCRNACEKLNDIRVPEKPPEKASVFNFISDKPFEGLKEGEYE